MSDMFEHYIVGFSTRRLKCFKTNFKQLYMGKSDTFLTSPDNNKGFRFATQSLQMAVNFIITKSRAYSIVNDQNSIFQEAISVQCHYTCVTSLKSNISSKNKIRNLTRNNIHQLIICTASEKLHKIRNLLYLLFGT